MSCVQLASVEPIALADEHDPKDAGKLGTDQPLNSPRQGPVGRELAAMICGVNVHPGGFAPERVTVHVLAIGVVFGGGG